MLQQTRVDVVIPYYERWLERFPTVGALADASPDSVLKAWEGLGYYSRARNLHRAARIVRDRHHGEVPREPGSLRALPGVGEYTAGAIASIAFERCEPAIDGNVRRVYARLLDLPDPAPAKLRALASEMLDPERPGDFNQALMELGALVCTPRAPRCAECPVARHCGALRNGTQHERPAARRPSRPIPSLLVGTALITDPLGHVVLVRRSENGLLGGLWSFPGEMVRANERASAAARRAARTALPEVHLPRGRHVIDVPHTFTHRTETYCCYLYTLTLSMPLPRPPFDRFPRETLPALALPAAQRHIASLLSASSS